MGVKPLARHAMSLGKRFDGVFAVHKPADITSYDVIRDLQKYLRASKYYQPALEAERERLAATSSRKRKARERNLIKLGHGGTLDPIATGVLITGLGKGTKELSRFLECTKTYEAVVLFGAATDSYDRVGKVVKRAPYEHVTREAVEKALEQFRGSIMQKPSIFSALKVQGKKLYEYAREGIEPPAEILKRPVEVSNLEIVDWYESGTHEYKWPEEEANEKEKAIARKMQDKEHRQDENAVPSTSAADDQQPQKRKSLPPPDEPTTTEQDESTHPPIKRQKTSSEDETAAQNPSPVNTAHTAEPAPESSSPASTAAESQSRGPPAVKLTMTVSSGFYVRSLSHDLGLALGSSAIMSSLVRTRQGDFDISPENILEYKDFDAGEDVWAPKLQGLLDKWASREVEG